MVWPCAVYYYHNSGIFYKYSIIIVLVLLTEVEGFVVQPSTSACLTTAGDFSAFDSRRRTSSVCTAVNLRRGTTDGKFLVHLYLDNISFTYHTIYITDQLILKMQSEAKMASLRGVDW